MRHISTLIVLTVILTILISLTQTSHAEYLPIQNPGFEDQVLPNNSGNANVINAWSVTSPVGVFNWANTVLPDESPEGQNTAYLNDGGQILQVLLDNVQADSVYSLIVEVGDRLGTSFGGYTIELLAGATVITSISDTDSGAPIPPDGGFAAVAINYQVQPADPAIGNSLVIRISSPGIQTEIDAVRLARLDIANAIENLTTNAKYASIQAAIDKAQNGDVIELPPATFHEHIDLKGKSITLRSRSSDPNDTIIDGRFINTSGGAGATSTLDGTVVLCNANEDPNTILQGLTISNGNGRFIGANNRQGGALYANTASPTIDHCIFTKNNATRGGAAYMAFSSSTLTDCQFTLNTSGFYGGGLYLIESDPIDITNCLFKQNNSSINAGAVINVDSKLILTDCSFDTNSTSNDGGALYNDGGTTTVTACTFIDNTAGDQGGAIASADTRDGLLIQNSDFFNNNAAYDGGAIMNYNNSDGSIVGCTFTGNTTTNSDGGAIFNLLNCDPIIQDCVFTLNMANDHGGAVMNENSSSPTILETHFTGNDAAIGGAVCNWTGASPQIAYCTFVGNRAQNGGAMVNYNVSGRSQPVVDHCLFLGNGANSTGAVSNSTSADATFTHCTFTANSSPSLGALTIYSSIAQVTNCILFNNDTNVELEAYENATALVTYCNIEGGFAGTGNIDADPLFAALPDDGGDGFGDDPTTDLIDESANDNLGDQRLFPGSPCIDAGNSLFSAPIDLDKKIRAVDDPATPDTGVGFVTFVDLGAYEAQTGPCTPQLQGDINCDNSVDLLDLSLLSDNWLQEI